MAIRIDLTQTGLAVVAERQSATPSIVITGLSACGGQLFPFINVSPPHQADTWQAIGFQLRGTQITWPVGSPITADGQYEFPTGGLPLAFSAPIGSMNLAAGGNPAATVPQSLLSPITLFVFPDGPVTPADPTVNLSDGLVLDQVPANYPEDLATMFQQAMDEPA